MVNIFTDWNRSKSGPKIVFELEKLNSQMIISCETNLIASNEREDSDEDRDQ